jgi:shikimate kinase
LAACIALIGLSGAGKSRVAPLLAARLGAPSVDLDAEVEREAGTTVAELIARDGEEAFREREARALHAALARARSRQGGSSAKAAAVLACGGGIVLRAENRALLRANAFVVWLGVEPKVAAKRIGEAGHRARPLLAAGAAAARLAALLAERREAYAGVAHATVETGGLEAEEVARAIADLWGRRSDAWAPSAS